MSDKDNEALNNSAGEETSDPTPPVEEPKTTEEVEAPNGEATETDTLTNQEPEPKKGANQRIRELNEQKKQAEERAQSLEERMKELTQQSQYSGDQSRPTQPNVTQQPQQSQPIAQPGEELTVEQLEQRLQQREANLLRQAEARTRLQIEQSKVLDNIQKESGEVMALYPQLNPDNKADFDKDLSDSIVEASLAYVKSNPTGSVKQFVGKLMKPYQKSVTKQVANRAEDIAKQVTESAAEPNQVSKKEKSFSELSIKEMEEQLGMVY